MGLFSEKKSKIFKDESVLEQEYLPSYLPHREGKLKQIASVLETIADGRKPQNLLITGSVGTGKTTSVKYVLSELKDFTKRAFPVFINCWKYSTPASILFEISTKMKLVLPRRGLAVDEFESRINEWLSKEEKVLVLILDEVDRLISSGGSQILYTFGRSSELSGVKTTIVGITNYPEVTSKLDDRIRSSLAQKRMIFEKYTVSQLKDILNARVKYAFLTGTVNKDVVALCAARAAKNGGDARLAIVFLHRAGIAADNLGKSEVTPEDVPSVDEVKPGLSKSERILPEMLRVEKNIIDILKKDHFTTGEIIKKLKVKKIKLSERSVERYLKKLLEINVISAENVRTKTGGTTRIFRLV